MLSQMGRCLQLEALDNSLTAFVALVLRSNGFNEIRCDRNLSMGINLASMVKVLKCVNNDDSIKIQTQDNVGDTATFTIESPNQMKVNSVQ